MRKKRLLLILSCLLIFSLVACQRQNSNVVESKEENTSMEQEVDNSYTGIANNIERLKEKRNRGLTEKIGRISKKRNDKAKERQRMTIQIGKEIFQAVLYDNDSTRALRKKLPMTIQMDEMNGNEKYYFMDESIPTASKSVGHINAGDFMLFGSDCLVLFFKDFQTSYTYTRLGYVENVSEFVSALGSGSVEMTLSLKE